MKVVTFYSYKGGVGRTLAATNFAVYLAKLGLKVVIMDFDLEAPGVDSKFPNFKLPENQAGLIDYILRFQREGSSPGPVDEILCSIPISCAGQDVSLGLIPAGDYLAPDYPVKLNELDWTRIYSDQRDGVAFFQLFLERIKQEICPEILVIDSRTGFSEISGLCTQQLADETVMLSSFAAESIKMTRHLAKAIRESEISKSLNKEVETKIVICRLPKQRSIEKLKAKFCKQFDVEERKLFFLFSCPSLELEEFVAMLHTEKESDLVSNYMQLFEGLNVKAAEESIKAKIAETEQGLLSCKPSEAEARIRDLVALYPHPEVYRRAMRFFNLTRRHEKAAVFGVRLLELVPDDVEALSQVASFFLHGDHNPRHGVVDRSHRQLLEAADFHRLLHIAERAYRAGELSVGERIRLADLLEDVGENVRSFQIAKETLENDDVEEPEQRLNALCIAARTALEIGKIEEATSFVSQIPPSGLRGRLALFAIQLKIEAGDLESAFELAKLVFSRSFSPGLIDTAVELADKLGRRKELEMVIRSNPALEDLARHDPETLWKLKRHGFQVPELRERSTTRTMVHRRKLLEEME